MRKTLGHAGKEPLNQRLPHRLNQAEVNGCLPRLELHLTSAAKGK